MKKKENNQGLQTAKPFETKQKVVFYIILILIPIISFLIFEGLLRYFNYGGNLNLFVDATYKPEKYYRANPYIGKRYFTVFKRTSPACDLFLKIKTPETYRIFVMGCSTVHGFPYEEGTMFSRTLYFRLRDAFPDKNIEVINTSLTAVSSYTQLDFTNEIIQQKPDIVLIYTGHNEFYGALGIGSVEMGGSMRILKLTHLKLLRLKTYLLMRDMVNKTKTLFAGPVNAEITKGTLMQRIAADKSIEFNSPKYFAGLRQYKYNMSEVLKRYNRAHIPVIISDLVSNIKDQQPFYTNNANNQKSINVYKQALEEEKLRNYVKAKKLFYEAKDLDAVRFRATEDINTITREIAAQNHAGFLSMEAVFEKNSPHGIIGDNLMIDHLHPNVDGYFLMADAFFNSLKEKGFIAPKWNDSLVKPDSFYRNILGITPLENYFANITIGHLKAGWPFKPDTVENKFKSEYKSSCLEDSLALLCVKYNNVSMWQMHEKIIKFYTRYGEYKKTAAEYIALAKTYPYSNNFYIKTAIELIKAENYTEALYWLNLSNRVEENSYTWMKCGEIYYLNGDINNSLNALLRAKELINNSDNKLKIYSDLYNLYLAKKMNFEANKMLNGIKELNPQYKNPGISLKDDIIYIPEIIRRDIINSIQLLKQGKVDDAINLLQNSLKKTESAMTYKLLGEAYIQKKDKQAFFYLEKSYELNSNDADLLYNLSLLNFIFKRFDKGEKYYKELKTISPHSPLLNKLEDLIKRNH